MLEKLSGDAVEPDQLAQLHEIGLSQPLRPAQGPGGAEVEWWKLGNIVLDFLIGLIPIIGDFLDAGFKANAKNIKLLLTAIENKQDQDLQN